MENIFLSLFLVHKIFVIFSFYFYIAYKKDPGLFCVSKPYIFRIAPLTGSKPPLWGLPQDHT